MMHPLHTSPPLDTCLYDQFEESVAVYQRDATCLYINPATERLMGKTRAEMQGRVLWDIFPEAIGNPFYQAFQRVAVTEKQETFEYCYPYWNQVFLNRLYVCGPFVYVFARDITARKHQEAERSRLAAALEMERSRLQSVFQEAPAYVALFQGPDHVYVLSSRLNDQFLGHREVLGRPLREAVPEAAAQGFTALLDAVYATGVPFIGKEVETHTQQPDGSQRTVFNNFVYQATRDGAGHIDGVAVFGFDVTEQVLARRRLEELAADNARLYQEAQKAIRMRDDFLSVASHELKTPLTALNLKLQSLERELKGQPDTAFRQKALASVEVGRRQIRKLSELVGDLLDVSRIGSGRLTLTLGPVDLSALVRDVLVRFEPMAAQAGSRFDADITSGVVGHWDALRLEQVVVNLVDNAIKYGAGRPVRVQLDLEGRAARLRVQDQGIGIAPTDLPRIFQRFERAVSDRHYGGLGLGLYITQSIVEAMDGHILVWSELGRGACFTVTLPT